MLCVSYTFILQPKSRVLKLKDGLVLLPLKCMWEHGKSFPIPPAFYWLLHSALRVRP